MTIMKKMMLMLVAMMCMLTAAAQDFDLTVNIEAGGLARALGAQRYTVNKLKVVGKINGDDIATLRSMMTGQGNLEVLSLADAMIVNGGGSYMGGRTQTLYTHRNDIGARMFSGCTSLRVIVLPNKARKISYDAFSNCPNLQAFIIKESDHFCSVDGILFSKDVKNLIRCPEGIPVDEVEVLEGTEQIYTGAFNNIRSLRKVVLPSTCKGVSNMSFTGCPLNLIVMNGEKAPAMEHAFDATVVQNATLSIPSGARMAYTSANFWRDFRNIVER